VREAATATEAARVMMMLAVETSAQEAAAMGDSAVVHVKDLEDWAALVERVAQKRVSRVEAENAMALASARQDAKGLIRKIALREGELAEV
jgi:hypothetical protein